MKSVLIALASILLLQAVSARSAALDAPSTCEDVLKAETCTKLRNLAKIFHENVQMVNQLVSEAVQKHLSNAQDIIMYVRDQLIAKANNFKCEDVLSADQCTKLTAIAQKFKVSAADLIQDIKEAVADGIVKGQALYQKTVEIMLEKINNFSCDQVMDADTCAKIEDFAKKIHANSQDVKKAIIDAYAKGLTKAQDFFDDAKEFLTNEITCEKVLGQDRCDKVKKVAELFGVKLNEVMEKLRELYANGVQRASELYVKIAQYIKDQWFGYSISEDEFMELMDML
ncbi:uncharacterized protein [Clytia hemisphaerica]|uniref:Secreted protein n=1 Tax=Clytia hemisphaerica TaxID=252671 RepID=A0A7M5VGK2_9CNID